MDIHKEKISNDRKKLCIVIPIYSGKLSHDDIICINLVIKNKGENDLIILAPYGLIIENMPIEEYKYEYFEKQYFRNADSYSRLLMNERFYKRFQNRYEYIFIIQLDALLLKPINDEFYNYFRYDYIGAPWEPPVIGYRCYFKGMSLIKKILKPRPLSVGNGGASLRNISACIDLIKKNLLAAAIWNTGEDVFFSYYGQISNTFKIAPKEIAYSFAMEQHVEEYMEKGIIPFAVHAYKKYYPEIVTQYKEFFQS